MRRENRLLGNVALSCGRVRGNIDGADERIVVGPNRRAVKYIELWHEKPLSCADIRKIAVKIVHYDLLRMKVYQVADVA